MKNILLIGVGGTGSNAVDILTQKRKEFGNQTDNRITSIVFDTDAGSVENISAATVIPMTDNASVGTICDRIGTQYLREWFPCDDTWVDYKSVRAQEMVRGASQWRKKSFLAFVNLMNKPMARNTFINALESMVANPGASCEVYVISSVAGGTGSGSFIPIALYTKRYLRKCLGKDPIVNAMIALPDIYADSQTPDNKVKVYANAYAILRELNAINLVAHNFNDDNKTEKKAPVKFRIGDPREPNVGVLFDSEDEQYWTPEAAPFTQIFILDRIPGLKSISAHDMVMADSLYTLICTDIGAAFDSEASNHEILHSQSNGSNAIYAGISTSQIRFPKETILEYLSRRKALGDCEKEWMVLHRKVEATIAENVQQAKDNNDRYVLKDGGYADLVLKALDGLEENGNGLLVSDMVDRGTASRDEEGNKDGNTSDKFYDYLFGELATRLPSAGKYLDGAPKKPDKANQTDKVAKAASDESESLLEYFIDCVNYIKRSSTGIAEAVLTFDENRGMALNKSLSIIEVILKKDNKFIHPVAAMVQLCRLKLKLAEFIEKHKSNVWGELKKRVIEELPAWAMELDSAPKPKSAARSAYANSPSGKNRFADLCNKPNDYKAKRTDARLDMEILRKDYESLINKINRQAVEQLQYAVFKKISDNLDILIEKYRNFFSRFDKEREELEEETKTVLRKDCGTVDSIINVYSSIADKEEILRDVFKNAGPESEAQLVETDDIAGKGVFATAYGAAVAASKQDETWNEKDSRAYRSLFTNMVAAYREYIAKSDAYAKIASFNVVQAIECSCKDKDKLESEFRTCFSTAQELATPSLRINTGDACGDLVKPSNVVVFMMSLETGKYIKKNADKLGLHLPANQNKESTVIRSCVEEFVRRYSGDDSARVSIVENMPDDVLYCTVEIMDISPLRIAKFDECGTDNIYFRNYKQALLNAKNYATDMWNPHIGKDLHRRGYLPYMNEAMEEECDIKMIKALLFALSTGGITYTASGLAMTNDVYSFRYITSKGDDKRPVFGPDGAMVQMKNVAQLVAWLRNEDDLVDKWSLEFDKAIMDQLNALPNIASNSEVPRLEAAITNSKFISQLKTMLFADPSMKSADDVSADKKVGLGILEFAYYVRTSEESSKDCDDAERILRVAYDVFKQFCAFRANPELNPERFIQVYRQQIGNIFAGLATSRIFQKEAKEESRRIYFDQFVSWLNGAGVFLNISNSSPIDDKGNVCITDKFDYSEYPDVMKALRAVAPKKSVSADKQPADVVPSDDDYIDTDDVDVTDEDETN